MSALQKIEFYQNIRNLIVEAGRKTWAVANSVMAQTYWHIERMIVEEEQGGSARAVYGENLLGELAVQLTSEVGQGFTLTNLNYIRKFYLLSKKAHAPRAFYEKEAVECQWSTRQLERKIPLNQARTFILK